MAVFPLKQGNTRPILRVQLMEPDPDNPGKQRPFDHAGATGYRLNIHLADGSKLSREMVPVGAAPGGGQPDTRKLEYVWIPTDWDPVSGGGTVGGLVLGPQLPLTPGEREHLMDYDVLGAGGAVLVTFPNGGESESEAYDTLRVWARISAP